MRTKTIIVSCILITALMATFWTGCVSKPDQPPVVDFTYSPTTPEVGETVSFQSNSQVYDAMIASYEWDFGDGNTSTDMYASHSFASPGTYTVTLTITDTNGQSTTDGKEITVYGPPPPVDEWYEEIVEIAPEDASVTVLTESMSGPINITSVGDAPFSSTDLRPGSDPDIVEITDEELVINQKVYFAFIDHQPGAFYAHPVSYVFIDPWTGSYAIVDTDWPPEINGYSMWDTQLGMGSLIEFWPVPDNPIPIDSLVSQAPEADYGDAPDGQDAYHGVPGHFPTLFNTANSHFGQPGGHTLTVGEETLGLSVSAEVDATDPNDPDGVPNLVDADLDDPIYVIGGQNQAMLAFFVTVSPSAPDVPRYVNALIDFDYSGNWSDGAQGAEWVVVNMEVNVAPGESKLIVTPFSWTNPPPSTSGVWMRLALTRSEIDESLYANVGGWDGSGVYEFGEIEDHLIFLTSMPPRPEDTEDWPPPPPDGNGDGNGGGPPPPEPGPEKGPCGYDINYYVLIINCGDMAKHMAQGIPIAQAASSSVASATQGQGYSSAGNLSPGGAGASETSLANIGTAIANLAAKAKCGDHVLIYICGHGSKKSTKKPEGGISIYDSSGHKTGDLLTPSALADMLGDFDACDGQDCGTEGCCHVSVVIESCYAGNFNIPGLNDNENIVVSGSSTNTPAQGCIPGGGVYTAGFVNGLQNPDADTDDPPNGVDPAEAHDSADSAVQNNPRSKKGNQQSWSEGDWCDCKCPCSPGIDVEKWIWYEPLEMWVDEMEVELGQPLEFLIEIGSTGTCRDIIDLEIIDTMDDCLEYADEAILYYNGEPLGYRPPDGISAVTGGTQLSWSLSESEIGALPPGDSIAIKYYAYPIEPDINVNEVFGSAHCSYDYNNIVTDDDSVTLLVGAPPEDLLTGSLTVSNIECVCDQWGCDSFFDVYCEVEALTGVVTYAALYVDGAQYAFWELNTPSFAQLVPDIPTDCDRQLVPVELVAMSLTSVEPVIVATAYVTTPPPPIEEEVLYGDLSAETYYECDQWGNCVYSEVYIDFYAEDISQLLGPYPVTNVVLYVNGWLVYDSGPISETYFSSYYDIYDAGCGVTYNLQMVATNSIGLTVTVNSSISVPLFCQQ